MRFADDILSRCWFLAGPTASGKTAVGCELTELLHGEIIALDSMSLYRGMDVGTAKPDALAQARVPHHLIDILEPHQEYSLAEYVRAAEGAARQIVSRGRVPLFVGGTGLYLRGVLRGVFEGPPADWELRRQLEAFAQVSGNESLHDRLRMVDPQLAARLPAADVRRVIRGIEVFEQTAIPLSEQQRQDPRPAAGRPPVYWLHPPRAWLYQRIDKRVDEMFRSGLVAEVQRLLERDHPPGKTARQALGYKEVIDHLEHAVPLSETIALIKTRTRQFAKRQHTWFKNLVECTPIEISEAESPREIAARLAVRTRNDSRVRATDETQIEDGRKQTYEKREH
jgi:tRNA dimethylallyltransferase